MAAADLFSETRPRVLWGEPEMQADCDRTRWAVLRLSVTLMHRTKWTLSNAPERLTDELCQLIFGDDRANTNTRLEVQDFAASVMEDAVKTFMGDRSASWRHEPEDDPDDSELTVIKRVN
jgi:hypothetical protein